MYPYLDGNYSNRWALSFLVTKPCQNNACCVATSVYCEKPCGQPNHWLRKRWDILGRRTPGEAFG